MQTSSIVTTSQVLDQRELLTGAEIIAAAMSHKGLRVNPNSEDSNPFEICELTGNALSSLRLHNIHQVHHHSGRPLEPGISRFEDLGELGSGTLEGADSSPNRPPSCAWTFATGSRKQIEIRAHGEVEEQGVRLTPTTNGIAPNAESHLRVLRVLDRCKLTAHPLTRQVVDSAEGCILIPWSDLGLSGITAMHQLFLDFCQGREAIEKLIQLQIFTPEPRSLRGTTKLDAAYIPKSAQPALGTRWRNQLKEFIAEISLPPQ